MYTFSGGKLKPVQNKQYTHIKNNYEITFDLGTEIHPCAEDSSIKSQTYSFVKIGDLAHAAENSVVDIVAIVKSVGDCTTIVSQKQEARS